jgi:hypothetical protein
MRLVCNSNNKLFFRAQSKSNSAHSSEELDLPSVRRVNMSDFITTSSLFNNDKLSNYFRDTDGDLFLD